MAEKMTAQEALVNTAMVCTNAKQETLDILIRSASYAIGQADQVGIKDVFEIGMTDKLIRLQRNTVAYKMLLEQAKDAAMCIKDEIHDIITAMDKAETERRKRQAAALAREQAAQRERERNKKKRAKKEFVPKG